MRLTPSAAACVLAAIALLFSGYRLGKTAPTSQEIVFNIQAQTVLNGKPSLFFRINDDTSLQPLAVYLNAAVRVARASANSGRIVSAIAGAINVALVYVIVHLLTEQMLAAAIAALILLFTPAHAALSIRGTDALLPATLIVGWLYGALRFFKLDSLGTLTFAAAMAGLLAYSHASGPLTSILLWILTLTVAFRRNRERLLVATAIFAAAWLPAVAWFYLHPNVYPETFGRWFVFKAHLRNPLDGVRAFFNPNTLGTRASLYWGFWDPSWLFLKVFLAAPLCLVAVARARHISRHAVPLIVGSALIVPLAGATFGVPQYLDDASAVLPVLTILAGLGFDQLVALVTRRRPLEDDEAAAAADGWYRDDIAPRP